MSTDELTTQGTDEILAAARLMLQRIGVSPEQLLAEPAPRPPAPTFDAYVPVVSDAVSDSTRRAYGPYWKRAIARWPGRTIDEISPSEVAALVEHTMKNTVRRKNARVGNCAGEHMVAALRCLYKYAVADQYIDAHKNPAAKVDKPRRLPSNRHARLDEAEIENRRLQCHSVYEHDLAAWLPLTKKEITKVIRGGASPDGVHPWITELSPVVAAEAWRFRGEL